MTGLVPGNTYSFKIEAHNAIGYGAASSSFAIIAATNPDTPSAPTTQVDGDNILISWVLPFNGGSTITGYVIKVRQEDATTYSENTLHCDGVNTLTIINTRTCSIPITVLIDEPYNLPWGSSIYANI